MNGSRKVWLTSGGENKCFRPKSGKLEVSDERGSNVEKSTATRKGKKDNDGELKGVGSEEPFSRCTKTMVDVSVSPMIKGGILSRTKRTKVSFAEDASDS